MEDIMFKEKQDSASDGPASTETGTTTSNGQNADEIEARSDSFVYNMRNIESHDKFEKFEETVNLQQSGDLTKYADDAHEESEKTEERQRNASAGPACTETGARASNVLHADEIEARSDPFVHNMYNIESHDKFEKFEESVNLGPSDDRTKYYDEAGVEIENALYWKQFYASLDPDLQKYGFLRRVPKGSSEYVSCTASDEDNVAQSEEKQDNASAGPDFTETGATTSNVLHADEMEARSDPYVHNMCNIESHDKFEKFEESVNLRPSDDLTKYDDDAYEEEENAEDLKQYYPPESDLQKYGFFTVVPEGSSEFIPCLSSSEVNACIYLEFPQSAECDLEKEVDREYAGSECSSDTAETIDGHYFKPTYYDEEKGKSQTLYQDSQNVLGWMDNKKGHAYAKNDKLMEGIGLIKSQMPVIEEILDAIGTMLPEKNVPKKKKHSRIRKFFQSLFCCCRKQEIED